LAKITMEITPASGVDPEAVQAWIGDGLLLERGEAQQEQQGMQTALPAGNPGGAELVAAVRRTGRRTNAEKAAEREAAEQAKAAETQPVTLADATGWAGQQTPLPPGASTFPPGIAPPGAHAQGNGAAPPGVAVNPGVNVTVASQQPIPAAMPKVEPLPPAENGIMRLEDFRTANMQIQKARPGKMNLLMRAGLWPSDKSAKESWFTMEAVPEQYRMRLIDEIDYVP
jgi:hypothetical protein